MSYDPSLLQMLSTREPLRDLVNMFVSWSLKLTKSVMISLESTFSLTKSQSIYLCVQFVHGRSDLAQCEQQLDCTYHFSILNFSKLQLLEKLPKPCNCCHNMVLNFNTRSSNCFLLLAPPGDQVSSNENTIQKWTSYLMVIMLNQHQNNKQFWHCLYHHILI